MALARRELTLHSMHNVVLRLTRDTSGRITDLEGSAERAEVVIHAEIDRLDVEEFDAFDADLRETLAEVRAAVGDFQSMRARIEALIEGIDGAASAIDADEREEARAFLQWLLDDNFTFLGYREFVIDDEGDRRVVRQVTGSELGVLARRERPASERALEDMTEATREFILDPRLLQFSQGGTRSRVHRPAWPD